MGFIDAIKTDFRKYAVFSGRATRPEYWYFVLFIAIFELPLDLLQRFYYGNFFKVGAGGIQISLGIFSAVFSLAVIVPHFAVATRRLHDTDRSGWWFGGIFLMLFVAFVLARAQVWLGATVAILAIITEIVVLIWLSTAGKAEPNRFGPPPTSTPTSL